MPASCCLTRPVRPRACGRLATSRCTGRHPRPDKGSLCFDCAATSATALQRQLRRSTQSRIPSADARNTKRHSCSSIPCWPLQCLDTFSLCSSDSLIRRQERNFEASSHSASDALKASSAIPRPCTGNVCLVTRLYACLRRVNIYVISHPDHHSGPRSYLMLGDTGHAKSLCPSRLSGARYDPRTRHYQISQVDSPHSSAATSSMAPLRRPLSRAVVHKAKDAQAADRIGRGRVPRLYLHG